MQGFQGLHYAFHPLLPLPSYRQPMDSYFHYDNINSSQEGQEFIVQGPRHASSNGELYSRHRQRESQFTNNNRNNSLECQEFIVRGPRNVASSRDSDSYHRPPQRTSRSIHNSTNSFLEGQDFIVRGPRHLSSSRNLRPPQRASQSVQIGFVPSEEVAIPESPSIPRTNDMPYEELLALVEQVGNVNTGLTEHDISMCLRNRKHVLSTSSATEHSVKAEHENIICVVCQAECEDEEKLGALGCGHEYHSDCIKRWLLLKNTCPICKRPAFSTESTE